MKSLYWIIGIIVLLVVFGVIFSFRSDLDGGPAIERIPTVSIEATVLSLEFDELITDEESEDCGYCPEDRGVIRIDKIDRTDDPDNRVETEVGDEVRIRFSYSARPTELKYDLPGYCSEGWVLRDGSCYPEGAGDDANTAVGSPSYDEIPSELKEGVIIFHLPDRPNSEDVVLPGLKEGDKIKVDVFSSDRTLSSSISKYELIS
jgi:hypothetical protein